MVNVLLYFASISTFVNTVNSCVATTTTTTPSPTVTTTPSSSVTTTTTAATTAGATTTTTATTTAGATTTTTATTTAGATTTTTATTTAGATTTTTATTTAGPTTTTTVSPTGCNTCTQGQIVFQPDTDGAGIAIASSGIFSTDATTGCLSLIATCTAENNFYAYMQFNSGQGGPAENAAMGQTVNAPLSCINGNWVYTSQGISRTVTSVNCQQAPNP